MHARSFLTPAEREAAEEKDDAESLRLMHELCDKEPEVSESLGEACLGGKMKEVRKLIDAGASADGIWFSRSLLSLAAKGGHPDIVHFLLDRGAQINRRNRHRQRTALMAAAKMGDAEIVELLIKRGANVNMLSVVHGTALDVAANGRSKGSEECYDVLLAHGAKHQFELKEAK